MALANHYGPLAYVAFLFVGACGVATQVDDPRDREQSKLEPNSDPQRISTVRSGVRGSAEPDDGSGGCNNPECASTGSGSGAGGDGGSCGYPDDDDGGPPDDDDGGASDDDGGDDDGGDDDDGACDDDGGGDDDDDGGACDDDGGGDDDDDSCSYPADDDDGCGA